MKLLGCFAARKICAGVLDADRIVGRRVEDEQRLAQAGDARFEVLLGDVVEEGAADWNCRPPSVTSISSLSLRSRLYDPRTGR